MIRTYANISGRFVMAGEDLAALEFERHAVECSRGSEPLLDIVDTQQRESDTEADVLASHVRSLQVMHTHMHRLKLCHPKSLITMLVHHHAQDAELERDGSRAAAAAVDSVLQR